MSWTKKENGCPQKNNIRIEQRGPEDNKYNYYLVETSFQCNFRQNLTFSHSFTSAEFSFGSKDKYAESRAQVQEEIHIKEEEEGMGNEEYMNLGNFKEKNKEMFIGKNFPFSIMLRSVTVSSECIILQVTLKENT